MVQPANRRLVTEAALSAFINDPNNSLFPLDSTDTKTVRADSTTGAMAPPIENRVSEIAESIYDSELTAKKILPHQITGAIASGGFDIVVATTPQGNVRFPVKLAADVSRFRVHIRNYSYADGIGYSGDVALTGLWWGEGRYNINSDIDGGFKSTPQKIANSAVLSSTVEWVSDWITPTTAKKGVDHIISIGWSTGVGAPPKIVTSWTKHWRNANASDASALSPSLTSGAGNGAPFDVWLECEVPEKTESIAFIGDSITVGDMHQQSFPRRYAMAHDIWPVVFGHFGARLNDWGSGSINRWTRYGSVSVDGTILLCGINDILADANTNDLKNGTNSVLARIREHLGTRNFLATILPCNSAQMTAPREAIRISHNNWLLGTYRSGIYGTFDFARAVMVPTNPALMIPEYTWDGTHLSDSGSVQIASAIPHLV